MASLKYFTKGNQDPTTIYLRFTHGRKIDLKRSTSLLINPKFWNSKKGSVKQIAEFTDKLNLQNDLNDLKTTILNSFNTKYANGGIINSEWLNHTIKGYFNQDNGHDLNYILDYARYYKESSKNREMRDGTVGVSENTFKRYNSIINKIVAFQTYKRKRYTFQEIGKMFYNDFKAFLIDVELLNKNTTARYINYIKSICRDAKEQDIKVNSFVFKKKFKASSGDVYFITFTKTEIETIFKHDFSRTPYLDNARDWLIIGVWTGQRVSDLLKFTKDDIKNGFIELKQEKTGTKVLVPLHPQVKTILEKHDGDFPRKIASQNLNDFIKEVCKKVGITEIVEGTKKIEIKKGVWRKVRGKYPKHELISSHTFRRSFSTYHYNKSLPTPVIMAITGHKSIKSFMLYINKVPKDDAEVLNKFWQDQEQKKNQRPPKLKVIKTAN